MIKLIANNLPIILVVLDGWGLDKPNKGNAISLANTPNIDSFMKQYPSTQLYAHGRHVGLPTRQVGNSEAGHINIGAGRLVEQDVVTISKSIDDGTFYKNSAFMGAIRHVRKMKSRMHLMGMISNGQSPHSDPKHLFALFNLLKRYKVDEIFLHIFTDGRDSPKYASINLVDRLEKSFVKNIKIATIMGRFYAMDRKKKWERTELAYNALVNGEGSHAADAKTAIMESYNQGNSDEFIEPYIIDNGGKNTRIKENDSVIFFNLRSDRGRQLSKAFVQQDFNKMNKDAFERQKKLDHLYFVAMTDFGPDLDDILTAFPSIDIQETLPMQLFDLRQLYLAETEKYAHVTYFFNGGFTGDVAGETQTMIPSPDVKSYDMIPGMSSEKLCNFVVKNIKIGKNPSWNYDFTVLNFAAPDMVGHTGNIKAGIQACELIDKYVTKIVDAYLSVNGTVVITADHGNIEKMINLDTKEIYTAHTTNKVPFVIINNKLKNKIKLKKSGILGDIAPTILDLMGRDKPFTMKRDSLISKK